MKHAAAFACVERELGQKYGEHLTREPRYGKTPPREDYTLTDSEKGSLMPDIVLHLKGNTNVIHRLYDFFFPCTARSKSDPLASQGKLDKYGPLAGKALRSLVTTQLGVSP